MRLVKAVRVCFDYCNACRMLVEVWTVRFVIDKYTLPGIGQISILTRPFRGSVASFVIWLALFGIHGSNESGGSSQPVLSTYEQLHLIIQY